MKAIRKEPGMDPEIIDIENTLEALQKEVGGYLEAVTLAGDLAILCDEEGRLKDKQDNCVIRGVDFVGTILIVGVTGEDFCDVPKVDFLLWSLFRMVRYGRADRAHNVWKCRRCGHMERFEADGPYENGWNLCPACGLRILHPSGNETA